MSLEQLQRGKATELDVMSALIKAGWELYVPILDAFQTDMVIHKPPSIWYRLQVKHREEGNEFKPLPNSWKQAPKFDFLIIITGKSWGLILPQEIVSKAGPIVLSPDGINLYKDIKRFRFDSQENFTERLQLVIAHHKLFAEQHLKALPERGKIKLPPRQSPPS